MIPELAVALRCELAEVLERFVDDAVALSIWNKARPARAAAYVAALRRALALPLVVTLWQRGSWPRGIEARERIGGELTTETDMEPDGQLWLFDVISLPASVRKRFTLPPDSRLIGRVLLPLGPPDAERAPVPLSPLPERGVGMGYLLRGGPRPGTRDGVPFLRLLPDLYPGEFLADPHVNFVAARRYLEAHGQDVTPAGERTRGGRILSVPGA